jgi:hypothetical protein
LARSQAAPLGSSPAVNLLPFDIGEPTFGMQQDIPRNRHLTVSDGAADLAQQTKAVIGGVILPP